MKKGKKAPFHLYTDVKAFPDGSGECVTCGKTHESTEPVDVLFAGVSCKSFSGDNADRAKYVNCCLAHTALFPLSLSLPSLSHSLILILIFHVMLGGYQTGEGCSGSTYHQGFLAPITHCVPAVVFFENVRGVAQRHKVVQENGSTVVHPMPVEASLPGSVYSFCVACAGVQIFANMDSWIYIYTHPVERTCARFLLFISARLPFWVLPLLLLLRGGGGGVLLLLLLFLLRAAAEAGRQPQG